ncbi:MAG: UvrD-helicase domain-containing protein [Myxococcales bacterium]|nr:UvrD-helicase domain-containing protein [Myxococcales bacterium]
MDDVLNQMLGAPRGFVEAAAGCGKTQLLSSIVGDPRFGRQLVLTHTHAGVAALKRRLQRMRVPSQRWHLDTIAGWSLRWATAYSTISGVPRDAEAHPDWAAAYEGARRVVATELGQRVLGASYDGVLVDEYQDCGLRQHALVEEMARVLPCRAVGDSMQSIFGFRNDPSVSWPTVQSSFTFLPPLLHPWRWHVPGANQELGEWLISARQQLETRGQIHVAPDAPLRWVEHDGDDQAIAAACRQRVQAGDSTVAILKWPNDCRRLARPLGGRWPVVERFDDGDLPACAAQMAHAAGPAVVEALVGFLAERITGVGTALKNQVQAIVDGRRTTGFRNHTDHLRRLEALAAGPTPEHALEVLDGIFAQREWLRWRPECVYQLREALRSLSGGSLQDLPAAVTEARTRARHRGRLAHRRTVGTPLLVKGLEFDHVVVIEPERMTTRELYVAITRGAKSLTVVSRDRVVTPGSAR